VSRRLEGSKDLSLRQACPERVEGPVLSHVEGLSAQPEASRSLR